jgi:hypothetical protein
MDERKKRVRPSKQEKVQAKQVQKRPQRVEPESRFDDLLKDLRTPAPRSTTTSATKNTLTTPEINAGRDEGPGVQIETGDLDAAEKPKRSPGKSSNPDYCRLTLHLPKDVHRAFKTKATALDVELSDVLERLIVQWLAIDEIADPYLRHFSVPREGGD